MPSPCPSSSFSDPASLGLVPSAPGSAAGRDAAVRGGESSDSFDDVLAQAHDENISSDAAPSERAPVDAAANPSDAALSAEQLAFLASLMTPTAPAAPLPELNGETADPSLTPVGAGDRSIPQLLAGGAEVLEYNVGAGHAPAPTNASPAAEYGRIAKQAPAAAAGSNGSAALTADAAATTAAPAQTTATAGASASDAAAKSAAHAASSSATAATEPAKPAAAAGSAGAAAENALAAARQAAEGNGQPTDRAAKKPSPRAPEAAFGASGVKFADTATATGTSGVNSPAASGKNTVLTVDAKQDANTSKEVGTGAANWGEHMSPEARNSAASPLISGPASSTGIGNAVTSTPATPETAPAEPASHAAELVHEIREIADGLWAVDRNSVEVKFNFGADARLSVRVEYRDGTVHATFRTESAELRDAIAREWQSQGAASEYRPYRVADPVFSSSNFSFGGDASRQQQQQQRASEQTPSFERLAASVGFRNAPPTSNSSAAAPTSRPESTGYLHAIA